MSQECTVLRQSPLLAAWAAFLARATATACHLFELDCQLQPPEKQCATALWTLSLGAALLAAAFLLGSAATALLRWASQRDGSRMVTVASEVLRELQKVQRADYPAQRHSFGAAPTMAADPLAPLLCAVCHGSINAILGTSSLNCCSMCGTLTHDSCTRRAGKTCRPFCCTAEQQPHFWQARGTVVEPEALEGGTVAGLYCLYCQEPADVDVLMSAEPLWRCSLCAAACHVQCFCDTHPQLPSVAAKLRSLLDGASSSSRGQDSRQQHEQQHHATGDTSRQAAGRLAAARSTSGGSDAILGSSPLASCSSSEDGGQPVAPAAWGMLASSAGAARLGSHPLRRRRQRASPEGPLLVATTDATNHDDQQQQQQHQQQQQNHAPPSKRSSWLSRALAGVVGGGGSSGGSTNGGASGKAPPADGDDSGYSSDSESDDGYDARQQRRRLQRRRQRCLHSRDVARLDECTLGPSRRSVLPPIAVRPAMRSGGSSRAQLDQLAGGGAAPAADGLQQQGTLQQQQQPQQEEPQQERAAEDEEPSSTAGPSDFFAPAPTQARGTAGRQQSLPSPQQQQQQQQSWPDTKQPSEKAAEGGRGGGSTGGAPAGGATASIAEGAAGGAAAAARAASVPTGGSSGSGKKKRSWWRRLYGPKQLQWQDYRIDQLPSGCKPILVFLNTKSGPQVGADLRRRFLRCLHPLQVVELPRQKPDAALHLFAPVAARTRILVVGGDGSVAWILSALEEVKAAQAAAGNPLWTPPPVGVLPLGTGNDLARCLGWGGGHGAWQQESVAAVLAEVQHAAPLRIDRWSVSFAPPTQQDGGAAEAPRGKLQAALDGSKLQSVASRVLGQRAGGGGGSGGSGGAPPVVKQMNNYLGIGVDAKVALEFHQMREHMPFFFTSQLGNKLWYTAVGGKDIVSGHACANLAQKLQVVCDGRTVPLPPDIEGLLLLNINSYMGGVDLWRNSYSLSPGGWRLNSGGVAPAARGGALHSRHAQQSMVDERIELVAVYGSWHLGQLQVGLSRAVRLGQGRHVSITSSCALPMQVDGEPWVQAPASVAVSPRGQGLVLRRVQSKPLARMMQVLSEVLEDSEQRGTITSAQHHALMADLSARLQPLLLHPS